jgi:hypothetical protein
MKLSEEAKVADNDCKQLLPRTPGDREHFWKKVDQSGGPDSCWLWMGSKDRKGYGDWHLRRGNERGKFRAHRMAYFLAYGVDPGNLFVCHTCDQPACCNPKHLWCGTNTDNNRDSAAKGRKKWKAEHHWRQHPDDIVRGERNGLSKLKETDVVEIRRLHASGLFQYQIGKMFGVTPHAIWCIVNRKTWKHVS